MTKEVTLRSVDKRPPHLIERVRLLLSDAQIAHATQKLLEERITQGELGDLIRIKQAELGFSELAGHPNLMAFLLGRYMQDPDGPLLDVVGTVRLGP